MGQLPYWHSVELSAGSRPVLRENEVDLLVENNIGLYQGKSKILNRQNGRLYLTSQRLIYIDNLNAKEYSVSIEHLDIDRLEYTQKFLRSSPKITIFLKKYHRKDKTKSSKETPKYKTIPWICPICSYSNSVTSQINPNNQDYLPVCETCGIKSTPEIIQDALDSTRSSITAEPSSKIPNEVFNASNSAPSQISCPTCTFLNHPSLRNCELCGTILPLNKVNNKSQDENQLFDDRIKIETESSDGLDENKAIQPFIKISFHKTGDKFFFTKLQETLEKFKWERVVNSGNVNKDAKKVTNSSSSNDSSRLVSANNSTIGFGIHKLAQQEEIKTKKNELIINSSLDDLQALLNKANEILELTESFKKINPQDGQPKITNINQVTKNLLNESNDSTSQKLYLQEISRQLSDFLINDRILEEEGGIITMIDLYALYNRGRVGINLISPEELYKSCEYFHQLNLPLVLKKINNVQVVQDVKFNTDTKIIEDIKKFIINFGDEDLGSFKYSSVLKISDSFNWSLTITEEILKVGLDLGELVVDQQISGKFYYLNEFLELDSFDENRFNTIGEQKIIDDESNGNQSTDPTLETNDTTLQLPEVPKNQPFPEAPSHLVEFENKNSTKSSSLKQLEGLQF
ncbi:Vacuolar protein-sorting-associated protein 36 [Wickerhamomyces ciferrii]|uniref:Vacuolar protein-sorting-associated protein 36 n=1 Tax=Wickerhamomyces ciferrii (strain ATCC 14091 / BCRC 22168 / CBS 111 / JCM 3599 / NBRC 0793 / NRRL Y-1031 F-60-10) TaxID=1206466 RepID=K0KN35_WICCF|nr:Vacuolar protein-sorting-associated protein 36 [Wickerhamomyces ciferrii]CCH42543.1 Vacuolar protein-sorting-associated protein 36 [Wickerhamomyces ciferrii]